MRVHFVGRHSNEIHIRVFDFHRVNAVLSVTELNNAILIVSDRHVIFHLDVFHTFDQAALNISCLRRVAHLKPVC